MRDGMRLSRSMQFAAVFAALALTAGLPGRTEAATRAATASSPITLGDFFLVVAAQAGARAPGTIGLNNQDRADHLGTGAFPFSHTVGPVSATSSNICGTAHADANPASQTAS